MRVADAPLGLQAGARAAIRRPARSAGSNGRSRHSRCGWDARPGGRCSASERGRERPRGVPPGAASCPPSWPIPSRSTCPSRSWTRPTGLSGLWGGRGRGSEVMGPACGPDAAQAKGWSLRRVPGVRQKVSATIPRSGEAGVDAGSKASSSLPVQDGITKVPCGPTACAQRLDQPERPALDRSHGAEGRVHKQDAALLDAERAELVDEFSALNSRRSIGSLISVCHPGSRASRGCPDHDTAGRMASSNRAVFMVPASASRFPG